MARSRRNNNRQNGNGSQAMDVDTRNGYPTGNGPTCHQCGQFGHKISQCPQRQNQQNFQNQNQQQHAQTNNGGQQGAQNRPVCGFCGKVGHTADVCFKNPANQRTGSNNGHQNSNGNQNHSHATDGINLKATNFEYNGIEPYCQICNQRGHFMPGCSKRYTDTVQERSKVSCATCYLRGHTASECRNPEPHRCSVCCQPGHKSGECKKHGRGLFLGPEHEGEKRFIWHNAGTLCIQPPPPPEQVCFGLAPQSFEMGERMDGLAFSQADNGVRASQTNSWPTQVQPPQVLNQLNSGAGIAFPQTIVPSVKPVQPTVNTGPRYPYFQVTNPAQNIAQRQQQIQQLLSDPVFEHVCHRYTQEQISIRDRAIRAHIDRSAQIYRKQNYNTTLLRHSCTIVEKNKLSEEANSMLHCLINQGVQFWRDPKAMEAIALRQKPQCNECGKHGIILDHHMRAIAPEQDVLTVVDDLDWGVFVMFDGCKCCNHGYTWVPPMETPLQYFRHIHQLG